MLDYIEQANAYAQGMTFEQYLLIKRPSEPSSAASR